MRRTFTTCPVEGEAKTCPAIEAPIPPLPTNPCANGSCPDPAPDKIAVLQAVDAFSAALDTIELRDGMT